MTVAPSEELKPFFAEMLRQGHLDALVSLPRDEPRQGRLARQVRKAILQSRHGISTARIRSAHRARTGLGRLGSRIGWSFLGHLAMDPVFRWAERVERRAQLSVEDARIWGGINGIRPSVLVNCSPFDWRDSSIQRSASKHGIPTVAVIPSWDNPSSKGCIVAEVSRVLVWSERQKAELLTYYPSIDASQIVVCGIPQFDVYARGYPKQMSRERLTRMVGVPAGATLILYATSSESLFPNEPDVVRHVAEAANAGAFGRDAHVLVRCHPADRRARYQHVAAMSRVTVWASSNESGELRSWVPPDDEAEVLAATLRAAAVCINTASTITLDAIACHRPVINVAYDGDVDLPYHRSVRRFYDHEHYRPVVSIAAVDIAESKGELVSAISRALEHPDSRLQERQELLSELVFLPPSQEGSCGLVVDAIKKALVSAGAEVDPARTRGPS